MKIFINIFIAGLLFGMGLSISGMTDPGRVTDFLDVSGSWDPTLLLVMAAALAITLPGFMLIQRRPTPFFSEKYFLPGKKDLDKPLVAGAVLFGIGWGIAGFCPGPAIASLVSLKIESVFFVAAMLAGQYFVFLFEKNTS